MNTQPPANVPADANDETLTVARLRSRDQRAFAALVKRHHARMLQVAMNILRCEQDSADAVQDALVSAYKSIDKFAGDSLLSTWLHRITVNASLMRLRSRRRRRQHSIGDMSIDDLAHAQHPRCPVDGVLERLSQQEVIGNMKQTIQSLPDTYRQVLEMRDLQLIDIRDTARRIGCSRSNVKTRLHRARRALRERMECAMA